MSDLNTWQSQHPCVKKDCEGKLTIYIFQWRPRVLYGYKCEKCQSRGTWESIARRKIRQTQVETYVEMIDLAEEERF